MLFEILDRNIYAWYGYCYLCSSPNTTGVHRHLAKHETVARVLLTSSSLSPLTFVLLPLLWFWFPRFIDSLPRFPTPLYPAPAAHDVQRVPQFPCVACPVLALALRVPLVGCWQFVVAVCILRYLQLDLPYLAPYARLVPCVPLCLCLLQFL